MKLFMNESWAGLWLTIRSKSDRLSGELALSSASLRRQRVSGCDCPPRQQNYSHLLELMLAFYAGGWNEREPALGEAVKSIEKQQFNQADIILVTDDLCDLSREFLDKLQQQKEQLEFTVYGVLVGDQGEEKLKKLCDRVWVVKNLKAEDAAIEELFLLWLGSSKCTQSINS